MELLLDLAPCSEGAILPILPKTAPNLPKACHTRNGAPYMPPIPVGTTLIGDTAQFLVVGHMGYPIPQANSYREIIAPLIQALRANPDADTEVRFTLKKEGISLAWITLSDSGAEGMREDTSGPAIDDYLRTQLPVTYARGTLLPDNPEALRICLTDYALRDRFDIICTTGGTGLTSRDQTPETTEKLLDRTLPGFVIAMMTKSLAKTPHAVLSRAAAGILGQSLVINLPGSRKAVQEILRQ